MCGSKWGEPNARSSHPEIGQPRPEYRLSAHSMSGSGNGPGSLSSHPGGPSSEASETLNPAQRAADLLTIVSDRSAKSTGVVDAAISPVIPEDLLDGPGNCPKDSSQGPVDCSEVCENEGGNVERDTGLEPATPSLGS